MQYPGFFSVKVLHNITKSLQNAIQNDEKCWGGVKEYCRKMEEGVYLFYTN